MCLPIDDPSMMHWLRMQVNVLSAWQAELMLREERDAAAVERLETHRAWLETEVERLERASGRYRLSQAQTLQSRKASLLPDKLQGPP